jgi:hypothetical protein
VRTRWLSALVSVRTACTHDERRSLPPSELVSSIELMIDMIIVGSQSSSTERSSTVLTTTAYMGSISSIVMPCIASANAEASCRPPGEHVGGGLKSKSPSNSAACHRVGLPSSGPSRDVQGYVA